MKSEDVVQRHQDADDAQGRDWSGPPAKTKRAGAGRHDEHATALFDDRQLATVLAALRLWQREDQPHHENDIATSGGTLKPLTVEEIDALCERINQ